MSSKIPFTDLILRVRQGDEAAARELVAQYETELRRIVRVRLTDPRIRRQIDSVDICQSVLSDFFVRAGLGEFEIDTPEQLIKLFATMARNKLLNFYSKQTAIRRDVRRTETQDVSAYSVEDGADDPFVVISHRELFQKLRERLTEEERHLADQRALGRSWDEMSKDLGEKVDTLRKRLSRAIKRVTDEIQTDQ